MHHDFAIACRSPAAPGAPVLDLLAARAAAGLSGVAFVTSPPSRETRAALGDRVTWQLVRHDRSPPSSNMGGPELNLPLAFCESIVAFLRDHSVGSVEFFAAEGDGFYFVSRNLVHRLVDEVVVRLDTPGFVADEERDDRACSLHRALVYAAELETIRHADRVICDDEPLIARVLAAFPAAVAGRIRARCVPSSAHVRALPRPAAPASPPPRLGVVIPHWNDTAHLAGLLTRLEDSAERDRLEIVVVDDGSDGPALRRLAELGRAHPEVAFLRTPRPRSGPFVARRLGVESLKSGLVALVDSDDFIETGLYLRYARALADTPSLDAIIPAMHTFGRETRPWIPLPKARFTVYFAGFAHTGIVARKDKLLAAFAHAAGIAADIAHCEDCILSLSLLFGGAEILSLSERAYHYRRAHDGSRSQSNGHLIHRSRLARDRHFDRCMAEALADGTLTPLDLRLVRQIALSLPPDHSATQIHSRGNRVPWHTHLYRTFRSLLRDPRYHP